MKKYVVPVVGSNLAGVMEFTIEAASEEEVKNKVAGVREGKIDPKDIGLTNLQKWKRKLGATRSRTMERGGGRQ